MAVVAHDQTSRTGIDRRDGFLERMKSAHPKVRVVTVQYGEGDQLKSTEVTKSILQAYPKLKGLFGTNEGSAIGVVNGVREMKRKVVIVGYDSGKQQKDAIRSGLMAGAITQNPVGIGYKTVEAAVKAIKGESCRRSSIPVSIGTTRPISTIRRSRRCCTTERCVARRRRATPPRRPDTRASWAQCVSIRISTSGAIAPPITVDRPRHGRCSRATTCPMRCGR